LSSVDETTQQIHPKNNSQ